MPALAMSKNNALRPAHAMSVPAVGQRARARSERVENVGLKVGRDRWARRIPFGITELFRRARRSRPTFLGARLGSLGARASALTCAITAASQRMFLSHLQVIENRLTSEIWNHWKVARVVPNALQWDRPNVSRLGTSGSTSTASLRLSLVALGLAAAAAHAADSVNVATTLAPDTGRLVVDVRGVPPPAPVFFSAAIEQSVRVSPAEVTGDLRVRLRIVQGKPDVLSLGLAGDGDVVAVSGRGLQSWAVRQGADAAQRFLDLRIALPEVLPAATLPREVELAIVTQQRKPAIPGSLSVLMLTPGAAVGFSANVTLVADAAVDLRVLSATGLTPLGDTLKFFSSGDAQLQLRVTQRGAAVAEAELVGAQLSGRFNESARSVEFRLRGELRTQKAGARLRLLTGRAALSDKAAGEGWHIEIVTTDENAFAYDLVSDRQGAVSVDLTFVTAVAEEGDWRKFDFTMPAGAVVPIQLEGLGSGVSFKPDGSVVPAATPEGWRGFLPANGTALLAWKRTREAAEGALAFTSYEQTEVRVAAGLLRQNSQISFRVMQGKLAGVRFRLQGPGEILSVEGTNVIGWKIEGGEWGRILDVRFSRPAEADGAQLAIQSQSEIGGSPARAEPIRLTPEGGVRHSGFVRVANNGAVRLEIADVTGMMQLAPTQFPGAAPEAGARQVFVYRFPSASYSYRVVTTRIQPEVGVSLIATYELTETARVINASLELDVREAALRDWTLRIPEDYSVVGMSGSDVADYAAEAEAENGTRALRIQFGKAIEGRQLLQLRLEKNQPAAAGDWTLPALSFPGAKSVRGHLGAVSTPGYRLVPAQVERLVEVPLSFFPKQMTGLQQAWRVREPDWTAAVRVEALGQSIQADVFHLYSLKEGVVTSSVLLNYFVVGAPASEWRIEVPTTVGNIDVVGQNVRRDWRREGDQVIVSLHQPVLGAATVLLTFEQPMSARGGVITPGQVRPLNVQAERGYIQVVSPLQVKHEIRRAEGGLLKLEPAELPTEFRLFTSSPSLAVYQYTGRPFALELGIEWYTPAETIDQVIDFAKLASQVSRDGQIVTEAKFFVKTRGRQALRLVLPPGVKLWEARVENDVVNAQADGAQTLVPLPARLNPNEPVVAALRFGQAAGNSSTALQLIAPRAASAPTVISEWIVRADSGRLLVPHGGNAELVQPALTETGFEWISTRAEFMTLCVLGLVGLGVLLTGASFGGRTVAGLLVLGLAAGGALLLAHRALFERRVSVPELSFAATVIPAGETLALHVSNVPEWQAMTSAPGVAAALCGAGLLIVGWMLRSHVRGGIRGLGWRAMPVAGVVLLAAGLLAQRGGAVLFFSAGSAALFFRLIVPGVVAWRREHRGTLESVAGPAGAVSLFAIAGLSVAMLMAPNEGRAVDRKRAPAQPPMVKTVEATAALVANRTSDMPNWEGSQPAQSYVQTWSIRGERLFAEADVTVNGVPGDSFLLLRPPAVLTSFAGEGMHVSKVDRGGQTIYYIAPERAGTLTAHVRFEMPVPDRAAPIVLPTGPAATQRVSIELDQGGWEFTSPMAMWVSPAADPGATRSGATLVLAPDAAPVIQLRPKRRDLSVEATQFYVESANLYLPAPGVVNGVTRVAIRPVQGRMSALEIEIPAGLTVGDVSRGPVGAWRFDPQTRRLRVAIEPAQTEGFKFEVETQLGASELPFALALEPLRVVGAAGEVGMLAIAFGADAQPEGIRATDLTGVAVQDFEASLLPRTREGQPTVTVQNVWRYGPTGGRVEMKIAAVAPEVRVTTRQVLSLDDDRMVMAVDLRVAITRVGVFKLSFVLPEGLEVEALSGGALSQWTEAQDGAQRVVTLHLNGRTIGEQTFNLTLAGAAPRAQAAWPFPRLVFREAARQTGEALIVPGKGLRLRAVDRERVTQLDPRTVGGLQPGTLAFRLLQEDWVLRLGIEALDPWVTVQALQEVTMREGQTVQRLALRYRVENAAVKQLQIKLPGLNDESARTVRATGSAVSDIVRVAGSADTWEIRFQRGIAGETDVQIEFQGPATRDRGQETVATPEFLGARQAIQFVSIRSGGRLELAATTLPRGWTRVDWSAVPAVLQSRSDRSVPALCFRVAEPEGAMTVNVRRHEVAEALKLRVTQGDLMTLFAPSGAALTSVDLKVEVIEKSTLRVRLPQGARLFNTFVNGESASVVREGEAWLFHVAPKSAADRVAAVRMVYATPETARRGIALAGPGLSVPLENVTWRVVLPPGYDLDDYSGGLRLRDERFGDVYGVEQYVQAVSLKRTAETKEAMSILQQASSWMQKGEQDKAAEALSRVSNGQMLDQATNEDARVQLRNLKTQQAILGLNTRRQRMYLDNVGDTTRNAQLEQAATLNPFMQGKVNFNPQQTDQLLAGNTAEENTALRGIASRIVDQQLAADPAPGAIDVTLPERGRVFTFTRSLQVDGSAPLELKLDIGRITRTKPVWIAVLLLGIAGIAAVELNRRHAQQA